MSLALLLAVALQEPAAAPGAVRGRTVDAATDVPVAAVAVVGPRGRALSGADGTFTVAAGRGDTLRLRRVGYRPRSVVVDDGGPPGELVVRLIPVALPLSAVVVRERVGGDRLRGALDVGDVRARGGATVADALAALPFVSSRSSPGSLAVSMRASRAEQVVVTLDGVPLNDPATGRADLSDLPLTAIGALSSVPGADPVRYGSGATGGVLALASGDRPTLALSGASFGTAVAEGAVRLPLGGGAVRIGAGWSTARNDFPFVNTQGATGSDSVERRVNADERRASLFASALLPGAQLLVLASGAERGLGGPMNVRAYDEARERTRRLALRGAGQLGAWQGGASVRGLDLTYADPRAPSTAYTARVASADADLARAVGPFALRAGVGGDRVASSSVRTQRRARGFASAATSRTALGARASLGVRADAVGGAGVNVSGSLSVDRRVGPATLFVRAAQAFRAPTLYDLYFASPQRVSVAELRPERVALDAEVGARVTGERLALSAALFDRRTRDAIVWFPGNFGWSASNVGDEEARGVEGEAALTAGPARLSAWGALYDATLRAGGLVIPTPYVPRAVLGATASVTARRVTLTGTLRAFSRRPYANAPAARAYEIPGAALGGLHLAYRVTARRTVALLTLGVENAGDVAWESVRFYPSPGRSWSAGLTLLPE